MPQKLAKAKVYIENNCVKVTEWRFAPHAATGFHKHEKDYVVLPMTTGKLLLKTPTGDREAQLVAGEPYFRNAGAEHDVINDNPYEFVFVETEII